ncbi:MAG TPA: KUP/HAK/KT family potassium transporter, partial [Gemmatimonadaceae bacterium]|nr:KUP/HAK/KT family potassium transporter [Gemmatimonadaceae bacterium]
TPEPTNVYGVLSLIVWSLIVIVSIKYIIFIMRADNNGEGGILALLALILQTQRRDADSLRRKVIIALGLIGAALLYGDGVITPAISVLSAVEGLEVVAPQSQHLVIPLTVAVLALLFFFQQNGTAKVGRIFGPVMAVWFISIGLLGVREIIQAPEILAAANPWYGLSFFLHHGRAAFVLLGAVVLAVTGAEALYADMGHFGKRPIRLAWFMLVLPALLANYFGQGALILRTPSAAVNPFYLLAPSALQYPLIALATIAAIIASQALISGAFSLTQQSVQLGYSPRVQIIHTSHQDTGQIFVPEINRALGVGCILVVLFFQSSSSLAAAYGIAVTGTMAITTILFYVLARSQWQWSVWRAGALASFFLIIDLAFFSANMLKIVEGGWVPLAIAFAIFVLMTTWQRGRMIVRSLLIDASIPLDVLLKDLGDENPDKRFKPARVPGTAVFLTSESKDAPLVLLHHLKHNKVLHENVVLLSIVSAQVPEVPITERIEVTCFPHNFGRVKAKYGFMQTPNVPEILALATERGIIAKPSETTYYLGRENLIPTGTKPLAGWRKRLFIFMQRNARPATEFFGIPPNRVVELGAQMEF